MPGTNSTSPRPTVSQLSRWWQEHSELDQLIEALVEACDGRSSAAASAALEDLAEALEGHLAIEEEVYFPLVEELRPELRTDIRGACRAHGTLRDQLDELRELLAGDERETARERLGSLLELFRSHETLEANLIANLSPPADESAI